MVIPGLTAGTTAELPPLPFQVLNFQNFDESIKMEKEKKRLWYENLMSDESSVNYSITKLILGEDTFQNVTAKVLKELLSKAVQLLYSGCGRKINGIGKGNFSSIHTYTCMKGTC